MDQRYTIESQGGDTTQWSAMATADSLDQAKLLLTSRYRRIVDHRTGAIIRFGEEQGFGLKVKYLFLACAAAFALLAVIQAVNGQPWSAAFLAALVPACILNAVRPDATKKTSMADFRRMFGLN